MYKGWMKIYKAKEDKLVTDGIYSYLRHPQYSGLFLVTLGFIIQWPSLTMLVMWPVLTFAYYKLAKREEKDLAARFQHEFLKYKKEVPAFFPKKFIKS